MTSRAAKDPTNQDQCECLARAQWEELMNDRLGELTDSERILLDMWEDEKSALEEY